MKPRSDSTGDLFEHLAAIIARLRDPNGGCPWDLEQTHSSLKPYLIEETYEVLDAIDRAPEKLPEELGDVLLQVMLHSQIGSDEKRFSINDVLRSICEKLITRHPHVFAQVAVSGTAQVLENWEQIKKKERADEGGMLDGIPRVLPALLKAQRIGAKVARVGFDWDESAEIRAKIREEVEEFLASPDGNSDSAREEFGDLLFTLVQLGRKLGFDCEDVLTKANAKFIDRFSLMEKLAGKDLKELDRAQLDDLWQQAKRRVK